MYNFFKNFPVTSYNGSLAINILAKVKFNDIVKSLGSVYYPYTISEGERPDIIAANYYDDPRYSWIIYLANDIVDPYYDWPMAQDEFNKYIVEKYGSIQTSQREIAYWEDNWYEDDTTLTVSAYNALPSYAKKYFKPIMGINSTPVNYTRSQLDVAIETNKTIQITVANTSSFAIGDYITQSNTSSGGLLGSGFIKEISDNNIVAQNILGTFANTTGTTSSLRTTNIESNVSDVITIHTAIPVDEQVYWTYVTKYDYENQLNEQKKFIRLIDKSFVDQIEKELALLL